MIQIILYFFLYSFLGWACECIYCGVPAKKLINRGFLAGPYCPIYGCGALLILFLLQPFTNLPLLVFLVGVFATSCLEYLTSYMMEKLFHTKWWDYSHQICNIKGRVCLKNSFLFGILVLVVFYGLHPLLMTLVNDIPLMLQQILTCLLLCFFCYDVYTTVHALLRKNKDFLQIEQAIKELHELFKQTEFFPLTQPLSEKVQQVLDRSDRDEFLLQKINEIKTMLDALHQKRKKTFLRLSKAFPNRIETLSRKNAEHVLDVIRQYKENDDEKK